MGFVEIVYSLALSFSLGLVIWQEINPRFLPIGITFMGLAEVIMQLRWRLSLTCRKCGFDPLLYLKDPKLASERVRKVFDIRSQNPNILDKNLPILADRKRSRAVQVKAQNEIQQ